MTDPEYPGQKVEHMPEQPSASATDLADARWDELHFKLWRYSKAQDAWTPEYVSIADVVTMIANAPHS